MDVEAGLAVVARPRCHDRARDSAPLVDRDLPLGLAGEVEPTDRRARERTDRRQRRSRDALISPLRGKMRVLWGKANLALGAHNTHEVPKTSIDHHETFGRCFSAATFESAAYPAANASAELLFR